jgi:chromate transporter
VLALILRGLHRIGSRAIHGRWLPVIAVTALALSWLGVHFAVPLATGGLAYLLVARGRSTAAMVALAVAVVLSVTVVLTTGFPSDGDASEPAPAGTRPSSGELLVTGLEAGSLTFGGAYTAIPFVQDDAVRRGGWMTNDQFLDGLALSGTIPAPLIIFGTFVGYVGAGLAGAVAITVGMFLPAFVITLIGHAYLERAVHNQRLHATLDGITAGVVGLVAFTTIQLALTTLTDAPAVLIFSGAIVALYAWQAPAAVPVVVLAGGVLGVIVGQL